MTGAFTSLGLGVGALLGSAALLIPSLSLAKQSAQTELELRRVTLAMGETGEAAVGLEKDFRASARGLSADLGVPIQETALAFQDFAKSGRNANEALSDIRPAAELSAASFGQLNVQQAANLAIQARAAFGITDTRKALNQLAAVTLKTRTDFKDLPAAIAKVARGAQRMNVPLERAMLLFGLTRNVMDSATTSGTNVTRMLERMGKDSKAVARFQDTLGVAIFDSKGEIRDLNEIMFESIPAWSKMSTEQRTYFGQAQFGTKAGLTFTAVMNQLGVAVNGSAEEIATAQQNLRDFAKSIDGTEDTIGKMAKGQLLPMAGQLKLIGGRFGAIKDIVGPAFQGVVEPSVRQLANAFGSVVDSLNGFSQAQLSAVAQGIVSTGTFLGAAGAALTMASGIGFLSVGLKAAAGPMKAFAKFIPGVGLSALVFGGAMLAIKENVLGAGDAFNSLTSSLKETMGVLAGLGKTALEGFGQGFREGLFAIGAALRMTLGVFQALASALGFSVSLLKENEGVVRFLGRAVGFATAAWVAWKIAVIGGRVALTTALVTKKLYLLATRRQARATLQAAAAQKIGARGLLTFNKIQKSTVLTSLGVSRAMGGAVRSATLFGTRAVGMLGALAGPVGMVATVALLASSFISLGNSIATANEKAQGLISTQRNLRLEAIKGIEFRRRAEEIGKRIEDLNTKIVEKQQKLTDARSQALAQAKTSETGFGAGSKLAASTRVSRLETELATLQAASTGQFERLRGLRGQDATARLHQSAGLKTVVAATRVGAGGRGQEQALQQLITTLQNLPAEQAKETKKALQDMGIFVDGEKIGEVGAAGNQRALASAAAPVGEITDG
jgi:TP901 family phage tail tape measure protein